MGTGPTRDKASFPQTQQTRYKKGDGAKRSKSRTDHRLATEKKMDGHFTTLFGQYYVKNPKIIIIMSKMQKLLLSCEKSKNYCYNVKNPKTIIIM